MMADLFLINYHQLPIRNEIIATVHAVSGVELQSEFSVGSETVVILNLYCIRLNTP
jgi:hypothetical protein